MTQLTPPPRTIKDRVVFRWLTEIYTQLTAANQVLWTSVNKATSALTDIEDRSHSLLDNVLSVDETDTDATKNKHTSNALEKASADHQAATTAHGRSQAVAVADLSQDITNPPSEAEVQAISDKVDELLANLRTSGTLGT